MSGRESEKAKRGKETDQRSSVPALGAPGEPDILPSSSGLQKRFCYLALPCLSLQSSWAPLVSSGDIAIGTLTTVPFCLIYLLQLALPPLHWFLGGYVPPYASLWALSFPGLGLMDSHKVQTSVSPHAPQQCFLIYIPLSTCPGWLCSGTFWF